MDPGLIAFVARADKDAELQAAIATAATPEEIVDLAAGLSCAVALDALRQASRELSAPYWPWAAKRTLWRRQFLQVFESALRWARPLTQRVTLISSPARVLVVRTSWPRSSSPDALLT